MTDSVIGLAPWPSRYLAIHSLLGAGVSLVVVEENLLVGVLAVVIRSFALGFKDDGWPNLEQDAILEVQASKLHRATVAAHRAVVVTKQLVGLDC